MDKITKEKVEQYKNLTSAALEMAEKSINRKRREEANEIISMVKNYISDSNYFLLIRQKLTFEIDFLDGTGTLIVPIRENLYVNILDGDIKK